MFPSPASAGPPPPPRDAAGGSAMVPPMPSGMLSEQGAMQDQKDKNSVDELSKKTVEIAVTKLMELKNAMDGLNTAMRSIDPTSDALMMPMLAAWQGVASKVKEVISRAQQQQPNMAGKSTPGATTGSPAGQAGPSEAGAGGPPGLIPSAAGI